jgi:hypothetical protein
MNEVWVVQHSYDLDGCEETKFIGVYSTKRKAQAAVTRLRKQPGFCDRPKDFFIDPFTLDVDHWTEGFCTLANIQVRNLSSVGPEWIVVTAVVLPNGNYQISKDQDEDDESWQFKDNDIVRCEDGYAIELAKDDV